MLMKVVEHGQVVKQKRNHRIIVQGDVGTELFVLLDGSLKVRSKMSHLVRTIGEIKPISIFGEVAFIEKRDEPLKLLQ